MVASLGFLHNPDNLLSSRKTATLGYLFFVLSALIDAKKLPKNCLKTSRVKSKDGKWRLDDAWHDAYL